MLAKSLLASVVVSIVATILLVGAGGYLAGGFGFEDFVWIFCVTILPVGISCFILGGLSQRLRNSERMMWVAAVITGFSAVTIACSIAAPVVQGIQVGADRVNFSGYFVWGPIYGICLLPVSAPLAYMVIQWMGRSVTTE